MLVECKYHNHSQISFNSILYFCYSGLKERFLKSFFKFVKCLPIVKGQIKKEVDKNARGVEESFQKGIGNMLYVKALPRKGLSEVRHSKNRLYTILSKNFNKKVIFWFLISRIVIDLWLLEHTSTCKGSLYYYKLLTQ